MILLRITVNNDRFYIITFRVVHYADGEDRRDREEESRSRRRRENHTINLKCSYKEVICKTFWHFMARNSKFFEESLK